MSSTPSADRLSRVHNRRVRGQRLLLSPRDLIDAYPSTDAALDTVVRGRDTIERIIAQTDSRLLVVVGPCSIHDESAAKEYATRLKALADELHDTLYLVMRVYFEKPRTTVGWKGFINDPHMDNTFEIEEGLRRSRQLLLWIAEQGLPAATEALDPIMPQYLSDLISWSAIGARTTESQTHREMASGLSSPVGIKNGTDGNLDVAINALTAVSTPHQFLGIDTDGRAAIIETTGNPAAHIVLRGGSAPNFDADSVRATEAALAAAGLASVLLIDCSHGNSGKDPARQPEVARAIADQIVAGNRSIIGIMLESHLEFGSQRVTEDPAELAYGVSITDGCLDWSRTETCLRDVADRIRGPLRARASG